MDILQLRSYVPVYSVFYVDFPVIVCVLLICDVLKTTHIGITCG